MEDGPLGGPVGLEDLEHVAVRVAVVDLQRQVQLLREGDVGAEGVGLRGARLLVLAGGAEPVQPRLPHHDHAGAAQQLGDLRDRGVQTDELTALVIAAARMQRRLVGMHGDAAAQ